MRYDGTQDPLEHLTAFEARMNLEGVGDEVRCRAFPVTLAGPAIRWFNGLPQGSIYSFSDISRAFLAQFTTRIAKAKHPINLLGVTQRQGEPTRRYLDRFNDECLEIDGLTDSVASLCLTNGLLNENFRKHLTTKPVWTMHEIQTVAKEYINDEEVSRVVRGGTWIGSRRMLGNRRLNRLGGQSLPNERPPQRELPKTSHHETGLDDAEIQTVAKEYINDEEVSRSWLPISGSPVTAKPATRRRRESKGKEEEEASNRAPRPFPRDCFDLKDALEQAIREGKLAAFSHLIREPRRRYRDQDEEGKARSAKRRQEPEDRDHGLTVINVVTAKNAAPRSRSAQRKDVKVLTVSSPPAQSSKKPPSISFGPGDQWFNDAPENPPMVITARVGTGLVKRILVDTGADSNIMFRNVFDALGLKMPTWTHQHGLSGWATTSSNRTE
ncbi:uncharacterized protein LOC130974696 [Arachis stenosperma]|uniref:uncharacterized protein LOC130974696 n=1 Tax=Arachis stenosperma TaxID=217475 RepID=UPI0025ACD542|nr:uncharacterized protein LOC130974696 [Arachis stenosperma]